MTTWDIIIYCAVTPLSLAMIVFGIVSGRQDSEPAEPTDVVVDTAGSFTQEIPAVQHSYDDGDCGHGWAKGDPCGLCADRDEAEEWAARERATDTEVMPAVEHLDREDIAAVERIVDMVYIADLPAVELEEVRQAFAAQETEPVAQALPDPIPDAAPDAPYNPYRVVSDALGDWIPEAYTLEPPRTFAYVLDQRVRWNLLETFDPQLELTAA